MNGAVGTKEFGYLVLGNVLGAGKGLALKAGGLGFRLRPGKSLVKVADGKRLASLKGGLGWGVGATTLERLIGWFARGKLPSEPSKFCVDWPHAGAANAIPRIGTPIRVPARLVPLLPGLSAV